LNGWLGAGSSRDPTPEYNGKSSREVKNDILSLFLATTADVSTSISVLSVSFWF
jgi:hypothetical protein